MDTRIDTMIEIKRYNTILALTIADKIMIDVFNDLGIWHCHYTSTIIYPCLYNVKQTI